MNFLFRLAGAVVYRIVREYREIDDQRDSKVEHITIGLANGDEYVIELSEDGEEDGPEGFEFGFRPSS